MVMMVNFAKSYGKWMKMDGVAVENDGNPEAKP